MRHRPTSPAGCAAALSLLAIIALTPRAADACAFVSPRASAPKEMPSAAHEDVLIVYEDGRQTEHFIRRVRFSTGRGPFGFVVPTPSVARVEEGNEAIWGRLRVHCPHRFGQPEKKSRTRGFGSGRTKLRGGTGPPVQVLRKKKLGDFTAFVLAASDTDAFDRWLKDNGFSATVAGRQWLDRYVQAKFHYVALRYDGSAEAGSGELLSKTVRISFRTPVPFYPYREPEER